MMSSNEPLLQQVSLTEIQKKYLCHPQKIGAMNIDSLMMPVMLSNISNSFISWSYQMPYRHEASKEEASHRAPHDVINISDSGYLFNPIDTKISDKIDLSFPDILTVHQGEMPVAQGGGGVFANAASLPFFAQTLSEVAMAHETSSFVPSGSYASYMAGINASSPAAGSSQLGGAGAFKAALTAQTFAATGDEDHTVSLHIVTNAKPGDTIVITNIPHGASLNHGLLQPDGSYILHPKDLTRS